MTYVQQLADRIEDALRPGERPKSHAPELYRLYALLGLVKGEQVSLEDVHDAWSVWMLDINPEHPALVPFDNLDEEKREEDRPYQDAIVRAVKGLMTNVS